MPFPVVRPKVNPSQIGNAIKRQEVYHKLRVAKQQEKTKRREKRKRDEEELGASAPAKQKPKTIEGSREHDDTVVAADDAEVLADEADDEFADYFSGSATPKLMLTTSRFPSAKIFALISDLMSVFPNCFYYKRGYFDLQRICKYASERSFTHLLVLTERSKVPNGLVVSHLGVPGNASGTAATGGGGPTVAFRLSSGRIGKLIRGHGSRTEHVPELILNNFTTRLGRRTGRLLGSLVPHKPEFKGRQVATFHNQRDFIFFRQHRYIFKNEGQGVDLQELGPRFTLRMKYMLAGAFDRAGGQYEWLHKKKEQDLTRTTFHL